MRIIRPTASPVVIRQGSYEALHDGSGTCLLVLDGKERYAWVQKPDSIHLAADPSATGAAWFPVQMGEYLVVDRAAETPDGAGLVLYRQLPHGYQEYTLPSGWPEGGEAKPVQVSPCALRRRELDRLFSHEPRPSPIKRPEACRPSSIGAYAVAA